MDGEFHWLDEDDSNPDVKIHDRSKTLIFCRVLKFYDITNYENFKSHGSRDQW